MLVACNNIIYCCVFQSYKINGWYDLFLPDDWSKKGLDSVRKFTYDIGIKYSNETGKFTTNEYQGKTLFGPPSPGQKETEWLPVLFTEPYFDCGRSNRWIVSGVSPIVDQVPRYLDWFHLRRETYAYNHRYYSLSECTSVWLLCCLYDISSSLYKYHKSSNRSLRCL
jgi:hypothetical protein